MKHYSVKDLMIPIDEYASVSRDTTLADAIVALEKAQEAYTASRYQHRAVLVLDDNGDVVGKIGQLRALQALEPDNFKIKVEEMRKFKFSEEYLAGLRDKYRSADPIIIEKSMKILATKKVSEFMQKPRIGEFVDEQASLDTAIHKLIAGRLQSLLVTRDDKIIGILRLADVFGAVFHEMRVLET
jgi:CBS domain-containing protein